MERAERRRTEPGEPGEPAAAGVAIRPMVEADLDSVMAIERATFTMPWTRDTFRGLLRRTDTLMVVAEVEGRIVGYAAVWIVLDQAELGDIAVDEPRRGLGIGRLLLEHVLHAVAARGVRELFLEVRVSNHAARRLYDRYGFEEVGRRRAYYERPREDALVLRVGVEPIAS